MAEVVNSFEYVHLGDVDLTFKSIPQDVYTLQVSGAGIKEIEYKKGAKAGTTGQVAKLQLTVVDHPQYSGRRLFETAFPDDGGLRILRRLQDSTGVVQATNEPLPQWLERIAEVKPTFRVLVTEVQAKDFTTRSPKVDETGAPVMDNKIVWKEAVPAV